MNRSLFYNSHACSLKFSCTVVLQCGLRGDSAVSNPAKKSCCVCSLCRRCQDFHYDLTQHKHLSGRRQRRMWRCANIWQDEKVDKGLVGHQLSHIQKKIKESIDGNVLLKRHTVAFIFKSTQPNVAQQLTQWKYIRHDFLSSPPLSFMVDVLSSSTSLACFSMSPVYCSTCSLSILIWLSRSWTACGGGINKQFMTEHDFMATGRGAVGAPIMAWGEEHVWNISYIRAARGHWGAKVRARQFLFFVLLRSSQNVKWVFFFFFFKSALSDVTNGTDVSPRLILAPPSEAILFIVSMWVWRGRRGY